ncbi:glycosyl transferase [Geomonas silvestris]|uniref:Glycosyl transferase n=1 Tax=Geomonas silvestris TaxID=2740184 RepID=A0A6V8MH73_9BACT|nr:glycosyltransferase [Geomonas silvestris]GFO59341.1 glycosyl transferase [Geomonas silvestris]
MTSRRALDASRPIALLLPDLGCGGAERVAVNLANAYRSRGLEVDLVLMSCRGALLNRLDPGVHLVDLGVPRIRQVLVPLISYLRRRRPAALLACMWPLSLVGVWAGLLSGGETRVVVAEHTTWSTSPLLENPLRRLAFRLSMRLTLPLAGAALTVSRGAAADLARLAGVAPWRIDTIYNPVAASVPALPSKADLPREWWQGEHRRLLAVGTLTDIKDYPTLLRALVRVRERCDARLLVLGEGEARRVLEALTAELGLSGRVFWYGQVPETAPFYERAELHVLSSRGEGLPTVIIEALQAGRPVVSTDCPCGPREILCDGRFGRLVPVGDPEALAGAILAALAERHDPAPLQARAADFGVDQAAERYLELLLPEQERSDLPLP